MNKEERRYPTMTRKEFETFLALHGSQIEDWPLEVQPAARELITESIELRKLLKEEQQFEDSMMCLPQGHFDPSFSRRILDCATKQEQPSAWQSFFSFDFVKAFHPSPVAASFLGLFILGSVIGYASYQPQTQDAAEIQLLSLLEDEDDLL